MKDPRPGEHMWMCWSGEGLLSDTEVVYYTSGHVDIENEIVRRALASALQRDGVADGLSGGFDIIAESESHIGYAGIVDEDRDLTVCDEFGETEYGDVVENILELTWVSLNS